MLGCKLESYPTAAFRLIRRERLAAEDEEEMRVLYVAMTRAKEHLVLCASTESRRRGANWADMILPLCGILAPPTEPGIHSLAGDSAARLVPM